MMRDFLLDYDSLSGDYEFLFEDCRDGQGGFISDRAMDAILDAGDLDLVLLDVMFGGEQDRLGFEILERIKRRFRALPVMMMTSLERDVENLTRSLGPGAIAFITKRPTPDEMARRIEEAIEVARDYAILGNGLAVRNLRKEIAKLSPYGTVPVLILGERGSGKERVARSIHSNGPRRDGPFIGLNCAGLNAQLLESELFGHAKGAFTGAGTARKGYLDVARGGTLFLDEVGEIPVRVQVKLLRVLEDKKFRPVGVSDRELDLDVQLISATNADVSDLIRDGGLRDDFYDRISAFVIDVPPLREYLEDVPELASYFLAQTVPGEQKRFVQQAMEILKDYTWPGNGRELRNVVWRAAVKSGDSPIVDVDCLPESIREDSSEMRKTQAARREAFDAPSTLPEAPELRANYLSALILDVLIEESLLAEGNAAAMMRDLFPGQTDSKRYLGQVAWKLVDWNPRILSEPALRERFEGCDPLWTAFVAFLSATPMTRRKLWDKVRRWGVQPPDLGSE